MIKTLEQTLEYNNSENIFQDTAHLYKESIIHFQDKKYHPFYKVLYEYCVNHQITPEQAYNNVLKFDNHIKTLHLPQNPCWWKN